MAGSGAIGGLPKVSSKTQRRGMIFQAEGRSLIKDRKMEGKD